MERAKPVKQTLLATLILLGMSAPLCSATDASLLLSLPLDEGAGSLVTDRSAKKIEADATNIQWAKGTFGTAARFGGTNSFIDVPVIPSLNGATQFSISVWAMWEGTGRYPNILTTHNWSPGGLMLFVRDDSCSFRMGRPGHRADKPGDAWTETGVAMLNSLPRGQWTHLCVVFSMPRIAAYVNGKLVSEGTWKYPVEAEGLRIGGWSGPASHNGLISDLRIYGRTLTASEVSELADNSKRTSVAYTLVKEAPQIAASFENHRAKFKIDTHGRIISLHAKDSERELLAQPQELVSARLKDGRQITARKVTFKRGELTFEFPQHLGTAVFGVDEHRDFFTFTIRSLSLTNVASLTFFNVPVAANKYHGGMANMLSDDEDAVCLRGYDLPVEMEIGGSPASLRVWATAEHGLTGLRAGLAAGTKKEMPAMLRAMADDAGVPVSKLGGPWSLGAEANRGSYLFADLTRASVDDWIEVARRGGFTHIHIHGWWKTLGHYDVNTNLYPNGLADLKDAVARIHAAGLKAGIHTLTGCIDPRDEWVASDANTNLIADVSYTLARAMTPTDTVVCVNEKPVQKHDVVFTYMGNGNAIRIGTEIIQYSEVFREPPYAFAKCQRGAFKTKPATHAAGDGAGYLQQRYIAFYPEPGSKLADDLSQCIANVFNTCELDQIYFDGSEGMMSRYGIDFMRHDIFKRLRGDALVEASCHGEQNWWFHSRLGAWDHPVWAAKRFHDLHIVSASKHRDCDLLEPQMGWWAPRGPTPQARGHFLDEMEYFAAKNLGIDSAMSIQGVNVSHQPLPFHIEKQFTVLGWYERLRLAHYFDTQTIARVAIPGDEFRLRQDRDGAWKFTPVNMAAHRINSLGNGSEKWTARNPFADQPLAARIEALYSVSPYDSAKRICIADYSDVGAFQQAKSSSDVSLRIGQASGETRRGDRNLQMHAENKGSTRRGAWAKASFSIPAPYRNLSGTGAMGVWIKGDGKGALLNFQLATPREYMHAMSDHYVTIDFTGWRYIELLVRERDVEQMNDYAWPYAGHYDFYRNPLDMSHISDVNIYLNNLPPGESTDVIISPVMALAVQPAELKNPSLTLNGRTLSIPVTMKSGDFLELESTGDCTHFNDKGDLLAHIRFASELPMLQAGENTIAFDCARPTNTSARAEVTINSSGEAFGTMNPRRQIAWKNLAREYEMPQWIVSANASDNSWDVMVRPGEKAKLEIELTGAMENPSLIVNGKELRFPVTIKAGQQLLCRGERHWSVTDSKQTMVSEGELAVVPPVLKAGQNRVSFTCIAPDRALVKLAKVYE